jgi:hypothetical protein
MEERCANPGRSDEQGPARVGRRWRHGTTGISSSGNLDLVRHLYDLAVAAIVAERRVFAGLLLYPDAVLRRAVEVMGLRISN